MDKNIETLAKGLEQSFQHWDSLRVNGGSDPFWSDGSNMNLVRNHIMHYKRQIEELVSSENNEPSLFETPYPDIYYRETPELVSEKYMAKADQIRAHARQQMALYQADPNFNYLLEHYDEAYPNGETRQTRAEGLPYAGAVGCLKSYEKIIESDDLVSLRRDFHEPYEKRAERWAEYAKKIRTYLETDHTLIPEEQTDPDLDDFYKEVPVESEVGELEDPAQASFDSLIRDAQHRAAEQNTNPATKERSEQMALF